MWIWIKEMGFTYRQVKCKPSPTPKQKETRLQWAKEKQSWTVVQLNIKMSEEIKHISTFIDDMGLISGGGPCEMVLITSTVNAQGDIETLDTFLTDGLMMLKSF